MNLDDYRAVDERLIGDLEFYCANAVYIKPKAGPPQLFQWNAPQRELHQRLERQREETGRVRAIIVKGRQMGISTYIGSRFYHKTALSIGMRCFILTHEDVATRNLFGMVKRIHDRMPVDFRPVDKANNANALDFDGQDSGYAVGTAQGTKGTGRSFTFQLFHGSEVAYWRNAAEHFAGVMQAIPDENNTETILESTAHGIGGTFYEEWIKAEAGQSDFMPVFLPWYMMETYRRPVPEEFDLTDEEIDYQQAFSLDLEQVAWMRAKNATMPGGQIGTLCKLFRQEYPATASEAFQTSGDNALIAGTVVEKARKNSIDPEQEAYAPRVLGVDVAMGGSDRTRIIDRQGRIAGRINEEMHTNEPKEIADRVALLLQEHPEIVMAFIDMTGGWGTGVYSYLKSWGYEDRITGVNFGEQATDPALAFNKRSEMWWLMREWFNAPGGADIPDDNLWARHICSVSYEFDGKRRIKLAPKELIKKEFGFSPDIGDGLGLTFAAPISLADPKDHRPAWLVNHMTGNKHKSWLTA